MLDRFAIFTKSGVVLWSVSMVPVKGDPVSALAREVLLPEKSGSASYDSGEYTVKWALANQHDLVFAVVLNRTLAANLNYVDRLLDSVKRFFIAKYGSRVAELAAAAGRPACGDAGSSAAGGVDPSFGHAFDRLLAQAEEDARPHRAGKEGDSAQTGSGEEGGDSDGARTGGELAPAPATGGSSRARKHASGQASPAPTSWRHGGGAAGSPAVLTPAPISGAAGGQDDEDESAEAREGDGDGDGDGEPSEATVRAARERLARRGGGSGGRISRAAAAAAAGAAAAKAKKGGSASATPASGGKPGGKPGSGRAWGDFKYSSEAERSLNKSASVGGGAGGEEGGVESGVEKVTYSGTGASGSGAALDDADEEALLEAMAASAGDGGGASGAGTTASSSGGGWFQRSALGSFLSTLTGNKVLTREDLDPVVEAMRGQLMTKNVAKEVADDLAASVQRSLEGTRLEAAGRVAAVVARAMRDAVERILTPRRAIDVLAEIRAKRPGSGPFVIVFVGVNGVGKSTSLSKVAYHLKDNGHSVLIAACDSFRAGAVEQLKRHCAALSVPLHEQGYSKDPADIAANAIRKARDTGVDVVLVDTAGRMQNNGPLMEQLAKLVAVNKPDLVLFVGEALVGNDGVDQLMEFDRALVERAVDHAAPRRIDGIFLTKFDTIDDKVGAALSMVYRSGIPVVFLGVGQKYPDLRKLNVAAVVRSLLA
jgi:signal recognition particle receptor subunit alpha